MAFKEYKRLNLSKIAKEVLKDWDSNKSFEKRLDGSFCKGTRTTNAEG